MKITVKVKHAGQKRATIVPQALEIDEVGNSPKLTDLIAAVVRQEVSAFNERDASLVDFLTCTEIAKDSDTGKIAFGDPLNARSEDHDKAVKTAITAFQDGLFAVFIDEREIPGLDDVVELREDSQLTFIRLTFLAGSFW